MIKCTLQWSHFINQMWKHLFCNNYVQDRAESLELEMGAPCTYTKSQEEIRGQVLIPFSRSLVETTEAT